MCDNARPINDLNGREVFKHTTLGDTTAPSPTITTNLATSTTQTATRVEVAPTVLPVLPSIGASEIIGGLPTGKVSSTEKTKSEVADSEEVSPDKKAIKQQKIVDAVYSIPD